MRKSDMLRTCVTCEITIIVDGVTTTTDTRYVRVVKFDETVSTRQALDAFWDKGFFPATREELGGFAKVSMVDFALVALTRVNGNDSHGRKMQLCPYIERNSRKEELDEFDRNWGPRYGFLVVDKQ